MKNTLRRLLCLFLCLAMVLPTGTAFATPQNHTQPDVTVAADASADYRYPAVVNTGDKLLAVFRNEADKAIYLSESTDNGENWSDPEVIVAASVAASSPDLSCLSDGTVILTYTHSSKAWMQTSNNGGDTWSSAVALQSSQLNNSFSTAASVAELDDGDILIPVYGKGSGTSTAGGWHADSVALRYSKTADGWTYVSESIIAREADETALAHVGDGVVYAFTGESGNVYLSEDEGASWELVAAEEPRVTHALNSGRMHEEQIQHPAFVKVDDDRWFVTFTNLNTDASKPWETQGKIVYGKMFYPASGWDATISRPLYSSDDDAGYPKGSPVVTLTEDNRLLTVYYDSAMGDILGSFSALTDWPSPKNESRFTFIREDFADASLSHNLVANSEVSIADGIAYMTTGSDGDVTTFAGVEVNRGNSISIMGKQSMQFDFRFEEDASVTDGNALWTRPYNSTRCQTKVAVTQDNIYISNGPGAGAYYGYDETNDTLLTKQAHETRLSADTWYTVRIEKEDKTFRVKVWPTAEEEPAEWGAVATDELTTSGILASDITGGIGFYVRYGTIYGSGVSTAARHMSLDNLTYYRPMVLTLNKTVIEAEVGQTGNELQLAANLWPNIAGQEPAPAVTFTSSDTSVVTTSAVSGTTRARLTFLKRGAATITVKCGDMEAQCKVLVSGEPDPVWNFLEYDFTSWSDTPVTLSKDSVVTVANGVASVKPAAGKRNEIVALYRSKLELYLNGTYSFQYDFKFDKDDAAEAEDAKNQIWFRPYNSNTCSVKIGITQDGVGIYNEGKDGAVYIYDKDAGDSVVAAPVSFAKRLSAGEWYTVRCEKEGRTFRAKVWAKGEDEPVEWTVVGNHNSTTADDKTSEIGFYIRYRGAGASVDNLRLYKTPTMTLNTASLTATAGQEDAVLTASFSPDVMSQLPAPTTDDIVFESSDETVVKVTPVSGAANKATLSFLKKGSAVVTCTLGQIKAKCEVFVSADGSTSATRWEFLNLDFTDWSEREIQAISKSAAITVADGMAELPAGGGTSYTQIELWKGDSPLYITGKHSFQFDFRFNEDDASNAVWFRPYYNNRSSLKVTVTPNDVTFYNGSYGTGCTKGYYEGDDTKLASAAFQNPLQANTWYTVRCEKDNDKLKVKVWARNEIEPDSWNVTVTDSMTDDRADQKVGFFVRYNSGTAGTTMMLDNVLYFKDTTMKMPEFLSGGLNMPYYELEAAFSPNIYAELPVPPAVTFESDNEAAVVVEAIEGESYKTALRFVKEGKANITATMADFKAACEVTVNTKDETSSATRWEFFKYDFTDWDSRPIDKLTKNAAVTLVDGIAELTSRTSGSYGNIELWKGDSPLYITGKHSFQFDFRFNDDNPDGNAVWFRPYYNNRSSLKVTVTQNKVALYNGSYGTACAYGYLAGDDVQVAAADLAEPLTAGTWYTVRCEKDNTTLRVKVWARGTAEPADWIVTGTDSLTDDRADQKVGFFVRYNSGTSGQTMSLDNMIYFKEADFSVKETHTGGLNMPFYELEASFAPDLYAELPTPPRVNFFSVDQEYVTAEPIEGEPTKATLNFRKLTPAGDPALIIAKMEGFTAMCQVTVVEQDGATAADRWEFYKFDFESWAARPANLSKSGTVSVENGVAYMNPTSFSDLSLPRASGTKITGKHSFQFDFCFDSDDAGKPYAEQNAVWFRPYYSGRSSTKVNITQDSVAIYEEARASIEYGYAEGEDQITMAPVAFDERLTAGTWYTVRVEKDSLTFRIKVWPSGTEEPEEWLAEGGKSGSTTDSDDFNNPVGFYIRYRGAGMSLDNLVLFKETTMTMPEAITGGILNKNPLELEAVFNVNIYNEYPTPPAVKFYSSDKSVVTASAVEDAGNKANLQFHRLTESNETVTVSAIMDGFFGQSKVTVMEIVPDPTTEIGERLELFVDDSLIDIVDEIDGISKNITLVLHEPQAAEASENPFPRAYYTTVIYDEEAGLYRGYYRADGRWGQCYCYVESTDGINWYKPALGVHPEYDVLYDLPNVIITPNSAGNIGGFEHNFSPFLDTNPNCDPDERYKAVAGYGGDLGELEEGEVVGLYTLVSPDGIHWTRKSDTPILTFDESKHYWAFDSANAAFWSEEEGKYVMFYRHYNTGLGPRSTYRSIGRATSEDFITWVDEIDTFIPPNLDGGTEEIYASQTAPYFRAPHIYIGTASRYALGNLIGVDPDTGEQYTYEEAVRDNQGATDIMLITSRAGNNYFDRYFDEAFMRPGLDVVGWTDRWNYTNQYVVPTGHGEMSFYHYDGTRYTLRTDGFASVRAGAEGGELVTKPVSFTGEDLLLNYSASVKGSIVVELLNEYGEVYPGFEAANCVPLTGDFIERAVSWKYADVRSLIGKPVKIRFIMTDCDLYSYKFGTAEDVVRIEATFNQTSEVYALGRFEQMEPMLKVEAVTSNGSRYELGTDAYSLRGSLAVGTQTITVYYGEHLTTFRVDVTSVAVEKITAAFTKGEITDDMTLADIGRMLTVTGINNDGSTFPIYPGVYTLACNRIVAGATITVTYSGLQTTIRIPSSFEPVKQPVLNLPFIDSTYVPSTGTYENISDRLELFVDDALISELVGEAQLVMHEPQKAADSENPFPRAHYTTVIYDDQAGLYRGYYRADGRWGQRTCYVESADGINWYKPALGIYPEDAEAYDLHNVIISPDDPDNLQHFEHNFSPFLDTNPNCDPNERFKAVAGYGSGEELQQGDVGLYVLVSPDGIHWSLKSDEPIIRFNGQLHSYGFDSQNVAFWSEAEQKYVCYYRHYKYSDTETSTRTVGRAVSEDFVNWIDEVESFERPNVSAEEQLYTSQTAPYFRAPHIYISTATRYALGNLVGYDPETAAAKNLGATDVMLMSSRAGDDHYTRLFDEAFLRPGLDAANWTDRWNYMSLNMVPTGSAEMSFYHMSGDRYTLRTDGFVSVRAGASGGELITEPVIFSGKNLLLNYSASVKGSVVVELQKPDGTPYAGFEAENCVALTGDWIENTVTWKNAKVSSLIGQPVRIRFIMKDCDLYSYRFGTAADAKLTSIKALFNQTETVYALSSFDVLYPMLTVYGWNSDGTTYKIAPDAYSLRGSLAVGTQTITVYYGNLTATFKVEVTSVAAESIQAVYVGDTFNPNASEEDLKEQLEVTGVNNNGTTFKIYPEAYTASAGTYFGRPVINVFYKDLEGMAIVDATEEDGGQYPGVDPDEPDDPVVDPDEPADDPDQPGSNPEQPGVTPDPGVRPDQPGINPAPGTDPEPEISFTDVPAGAWYHEAVEYVVLNGLMTGMSDTEFGPGYTLNRAMVVTVLWRLENKPVVNYRMQFEDVPEGQWYTEAIRWAASEGIVNGMDTVTYAPLNPVTREQLVTILWRYAQKKGYDVSVGEDTNILSYVDAFSISEWAIPAMQWACGAGVINGNDDGSLNPKGNTKRSEFAKVIMNFCENVAE